MKRALIVDDNAEICEFLADLLHYHGLNTVSALTGEKALQLSTRQVVNIAFIDFYLPGINGIQVMKELKSSQPSAVCILMSAYPEEDIIREGLRLGAKEFLRKPFHLSEVKNILGDLE